MMIDKLPGTLIIILIVTGIVVVGIGALLGVFFVRKARKKNIWFDNSFAESILNALGGKKNIVSSKLENKRCTIELKDSKQIDLDKLQSLNIEASLSGNIFKTFFRENGDRFLDYFNK